ncbi:MAG: hypothetical protein KAS02_00915 [Candidatus Pacebacteria bacterium]|nr:hypothetical protein [Candidatus Paceibacterota bacterium]
MNCTQKDCSGTVDINKGFSIRTSCRSYSTAFACDKCGRLHFLRGDEAHKKLVGVTQRGGAEAFLIDGEIVNKKTSCNIHTSMKLKRYFYKRKLRNTNSDYGTVADSVEKCPIGKVELIGAACLSESCCKGHTDHMQIAPAPTSWIKCEATTKLMEKDPSLGQWNTCVVE